jgi:hypothetical protein
VKSSDPRMVDSCSAEEEASSEELREDCSLGDVWSIVMLSLVSKHRLVQLIQSRAGNIGAVGQRMRKKSSLLSVMRVVRRRKRDDNREKARESRLTASDSLTPKELSSCRLSYQRKDWSIDNLTARCTVKETS